MWSRLRELRDRLARFEKSAAGRYWSQLSAADFMNSSFAFAALAVLSAFPLLAVSSTVIGGDIRQAIVARMGLNAQATRDVNGLISTRHPGSCDADVSQRHRARARRDRDGVDPPDVVPPDLRADSTEGDPAAH